MNPSRWPTILSKPKLDIICCLDRCAVNGQCLRLWVRIPPMWRLRHSSCCWLCGRGRSAQYSVVGDVQFGLWGNLCRWDKSYFAAPWSLYCGNWSRDWCHGGPSPLCGLGTLNALNAVGNCTATARFSEIWAWNRLFIVVAVSCH